MNQHTLLPKKTERLQYFGSSQSDQRRETSGKRENEGPAKYQEGLFF